MEIPFQPDKHPCRMKMHVSKCFYFYRNAVFHCKQLLIAKFLCGPQPTPTSFQMWQLPLPGTNSKHFSCFNQTSVKTSGSSSKKRQSAEWSHSKIVLQQHRVGGGWSAALCCLTHFSYSVSSCFLCLLYSTYLCSKPVPRILASQHTQDVSRQAAQQQGVFLLSTIPQRTEIFCFCN